VDAQTEFRAHSQETNQHRTARTFLVLPATSSLMEAYFSSISSCEKSAIIRRVSTQSNVADETGALRAMTPDTNHIAKLFISNRLTQAGPESKPATAATPAATKSNLVLLKLLLLLPQRRLLLPPRLEQPRRVPQLFGEEEEKTYGESEPERRTGDRGGRPVANQRPSAESAKPGSSAGNSRATTRKRFEATVYAPSPRA
jgi:hypothetical protein